MTSTYLDRVSNKALGQMLVEKGALSEAQVNEALEVSKRDGVRLGEALVALGFIGRDALSYAIAEQYGQRPMELNPSMVDEQLLARFDINFLFQHTMLPLIDLGNAIVVVVGDPNERAGLDELARAWPGVQIVTQLAAPEQIIRCLDHFRVRSTGTRPIEALTIGADSVMPRGLAVFDEKPPVDSEDFVVWLLRSSAEHWGRDVIVRTANGELQVMLEGETPEELGRWADYAPSDVLTAVLASAEPVPHTDARIYSATPGLVNGHYYDFLIATPSSPGPGFFWIRALRRPGQQINSDLPPGFPPLPLAGQCTIVEHGGQDRLDLLIAKLAAAYGADKQVLIISAGIRVSLRESASVYTAPFVDVAAAAQAHRATVVIYDYPPSATELARLMAATQPTSPGAIVFVTEKESAAIEALANRPSSQRIKLDVAHISSGANAGASAQAGKGNA